MKVQHTGFDGSTFVISIQSQSTSQQPALNDNGTTIDGRTQTAFTGDTNPLGPELHAMGFSLSTATSGLEINSSNNTVIGIAFTLYRDGIEINGNNNVIAAWKRVELSIRFGIM